MKWNELRIYMMQYDRTVNQIFAGDRSEFSGKRILLGITGDDRIELVKRRRQGQRFPCRPGSVEAMSPGHGVRCRSFPSGTMTARMCAVTTTIMT